MKTWQTKLDVGTIVSFNHKRSKIYETITHPFAFGFIGKGWVGIWIFEGQTSDFIGNNCNIRASECKIVSNKNINIINHLTDYVWNGSESMNKALKLMRIPVKYSNQLFHDGILTISEIKDCVTSDGNIVIHKGINLISKIKNFYIDIKKTT